jgi:hypothetical protein
MEKMPAVGLGGGESQIAVSYAFVEGERLGLEAVPIVGTLTDLRLLATEPGLRRNVEQEGQVRSQPGSGEIQHAADGCRIETAAVGLVGEGGVGVAIDDHCSPGLQGRSEHLIDQLSAGDAVEQRLGAFCDLEIRFEQDEIADPVAERPLG